MSTTILRSSLKGMWAMALIKGALAMGCTAATVGASQQDPAPVSLDQAPEGYGSVPTFEVSLGDLDGDGDLDAVFANMGFNHSQVLLNDGRGSFVDSGLSLGGDTPTRGTALGDLDGDGDVDAFVAMYGFEGGPNEVWFNCTRNGRCYDRSQPCCDEADFMLRVRGRYSTWP